jgi:two-component system OmpR family response regulator
LPPSEAVPKSDVMTTLAEKPPEILVVDDEAGVRDVLRRGLEAEGYKVSEAADMAGLLVRLEAEPGVSLITLDLGLADEDGLELARAVRARRNVPIIMITARREPVDRVIGLEHGADDYIVKPFHIREVLYRVASVLRRYELEHRAAGPGKAEEPAESERYAFETGVLDVKRRECVGTDGSPLALTDAEIDLLSVLLRHPARVLSRDELMALLKGQSWSPLDRTIDGHIARLRKKIEPSLEQPRLIKSVRGVGYVFTGEVRRL